MIRSLLLDNNGAVQRGGLDLCERWLSDRRGILWLDMENEDRDAEAALLGRFDIHPLAIQDAQRERHPPKVEEFSHCTLLLYGGLKSIDDDLNLQSQPVSLFVGANFLVSRHMAPALGIEYWWNAEAVAASLRTPGILATRIMHNSSGRYLNAVLAFEDRLADIEDQMLSANDAIVAELTSYKSKLRRLMRIFNYHERLVSLIIKHPDAYINTADDEVLHVVQDLYERCERLYSLTTMYYAICGDLLDGYLSLTSHRLNNTMRVLTVITAIFIPLSFIAGVYGMNFHNMPELRHPSGYFIVLATMAATATGLLWLFRRKGWL